MSEFSESYHIRTSDSAACLRRLRQARFAGLAFPPNAGWLTVVPYAGHRDGTPGAAKQLLLRTAGAPVLWYFHAEDHGWGFQLLRPDQPMVGFENWWDPEPSIDRSQLKIDALRSLLADPESAVALEQVFEPVSLAIAFAKRPACTFAELLGLPAYRWLSPAYAQDDPDSFAKLGAKKIGRRPTFGKPISHPPSRHIRLDRADLSAREAFAIASSMMRRWEPDWYPTGISTEGGGPQLAENGRLPGSHWSQWVVTYRQASGLEYIRLSIMPDGRVQVSADRYRYGEDQSVAKAPADLPQYWVDSTEVAATIATTPEPDDCGPLIGYMMQLGSDLGVPECAWLVTRIWWRGARNGDRAEMYYLVHPETGALMGTCSRRFRDERLIEERVSS